MTSIEIAYQIFLLASCLCTSFLFAVALVFSVVVMPGIGRFDDAQYLHSFQTIDKVIQDFQPIFSLLWIGSIPSSIVAFVLGCIIYSGAVPSVIASLAIVVALIIIGQVATITVNIPLNNRLQELDCPQLDKFSAKREREQFEATWCKYNNLRTWLFFFAFIIQMVLILQTRPVM